MTVVGTLSHEFGHYSVARLLGYEANINYKSSGHWDKVNHAFMIETQKQYQNEIKNNLEFPNKDKYLRIKEKNKADNFWITLGGTLQTILTGTIGLFLLIYNKKKIFRNEKVLILGWVLIFLSLFWLRQLANFFTAVFNLLVNGVHSIRGDEMILALHSDLNIWTIQIITAIMGLSILVYILKIIPKYQVLTFLLSGFIGGITGYYLWIIKFGKIIMP